MAQTLVKIRADIAEIKAELTSVIDALRPVHELEVGLRGYLASLAAPFDAFVNRGAEVIAFGNPVDSIFNDIPPARQTTHLLGLALAAHGIDSIVDRIRNRATEIDCGNLRMPADEREERLLDLRKRLYSLELQEEELLNGEPRRPGANPAAILGIPLAAILEIDDQNQNQKLLIGKW